MDDRVADCKLFVTQFCVWSLHSIWSFNLKMMPLKNLAREKWNEEKSLLYDTLELPYYKVSASLSNITTLYQCISQNFNTWKIICMMPLQM